MTPIPRGLASRLGLRKPLPVLEIEISPDIAQLNRALRGFREFMAHNDTQVREAFARLQECVREGHLQLRADRSD